MTIAIIGGGLAGCALMESLIAAKQPAHLLHNSDPMMASRAPTALFHPFPGRSLKPHVLLRSAVKETTTLLQLWQREHPELIRWTQIHRPLLGRSGERLKRTYDAHWREKQSSWLRITETMSVHPWITAESISYSPAAAVDLGELLARKWSSWKNADVLSDFSASQLIKSAGKWWILDENQRKMGPYEQVILAVGAQLRHWFPQLPVSEQGGELVLFVHPKRTLSKELPDLVSINGVHIGPHNSGGLVIGSTRWKCETPTPITEAAPELLTRAQQIMPGLPSCTDKLTWRGVRCNYSPNRLPTIGPVPGFPGLSVLATLGSKGLLWGPLAAAQLSKHLLLGERVSDELCQSKIADQFWESPHIR